MPAAFEKWIEIAVNNFSNMTVQYCTTGFLIITTEAQ